MSSDRAPVLTAGQPSAIGRYHVRARLTRGAYGGVDQVYESFDPLIERPVVVRVFHVPTTDPASAADIRQTFYREMQRIGALTHHGIATLFDAGELPDGLFMATEFVDGVNLGGLLAAGVELDLPMRVWLIEQITDALEYARQMGVAHLDLAPTSVLFGADSTVKVGGFGVAPVVDALRAASLAPGATGSRYAAPERARAEGDHRSDVFSLAQIALDLLGAAPVSGGLTPAVGARLGLAPMLAEHGVNADRWTAIFERALAVDPADRFETVGEFEVELLLTLGLGAAEAHLVREFTGASADLRRRAHAGHAADGDATMLFADRDSTGSGRAPQVADAMQTDTVLAPFFQAGANGPR